MRPTAGYWKKKLDLISHIEGGSYRQTYSAPISIARAHLPGTFQGNRPTSTAIYFLLEEDQFSAMHRIASDELWHFYSGSAITVDVIEPDGGHSEIHLGSDPDAGEVFQAAVRGGRWFASRVRDPKWFALAGCTVSPGFDFADFELGKRAELVRLYPQHQKLIESLTRS